MKKVVMIALLGLLVAGAVYAQSAGVVTRNGHYENAKTGDFTTSDGYQYTVDGDPPLTQIVAAGIDNSLAAGGSISTQTSCVDLSAYREITLLLTWTTSAASDSNNISLGVQVFNKESAAWGTNDTAVRADQGRIGGGAAVDTVTAALFTTTSGDPTLYIYRTQTAPTGYQLATLARVPRYHARVGGIAIPMGDYLKAPNYVGLIISNVHASVALTNLRAVWLCRK